MPEATRLPDLDPNEAVSLLARGAAVLVDVREPQEWAGLPVVTDDGAPGTVA